MAAEKWDAVRNSDTVTLHEMVTKAYGECSARQCILVGIALRSAIQQIPGLQNTTISGRQKYTPEIVVLCILKTQVNRALVQCLLVRNSKIRIRIKAYKWWENASSISLPCR